MVGANERPTTDCIVATRRARRANHSCAEQRGCDHKQQPIHPCLLPMPQWGEMISYSHRGHDETRI
jgi:hypothetical protein